MTTNQSQKKFRNGLVIGKFYPPHAGHSYLINTALSQSDTVTVVVCDKEGQSIPASLRARWLKEIHLEAKVIVIKDIGKDDDSQAWAEYSRTFLDVIPDAIFTSEDYGDLYASLLGATHILVDKERNTVPISATRIRANPLEHLSFLAPPVRAHFVKRVCVLGAESTGTTTMTKALAEHYKTVWVPEFGRLYSEGKMGNSESPWRTDEFEYIAKTQNEMEDELARSANKILICDTDSFATSLWHERYMGAMSETVDAISADRNYDMYFLTDVDIPFVQDGLRDGEHIRHGMHKRFVEELEKRNMPYVLLSGSHEVRLKKAIEICDNVIRR